MTHSSAASLMLLCATTSAACVRGGAPVPVAVTEVPTHSYVATVRATFETAERGTTGLPAAVTNAPAVVETWSINLGTSPGRRYRDDSVGEVVRFTRASVQIDDQPAAVHPLTGHAVVLRRFASGEILAVEYADHVVGGDRQLEVLDLLLPVLSPKVPSLSKGETITWNTRWPLPLGPAEKLTGMLRADWTLAAVEKMDGEPVWHLTYRGDWNTRVQTRAGDRRSWTHTDAPGTASGDLWLSRADGSVRRHEFNWQRSVVVPVLGSGDAVLLQKQQFDGILERQ